MKQFTKTSLNELRADLHRAVQAVADKHGLKIDTGRIKYSATACTVPLEVAVLGESGIPQTRERSAWVMAAMYGMKPEWLDREFTYQGTRYRVSGINPKKHARPIVCQNAQNGRDTFFPEELAKALLR